MHHNVVNHELSLVHIQNKKAARPITPAAAPKAAGKVGAALVGRAFGELPVTPFGRPTIPVAAFLTDVIVVEAATAPGTGVVPLTIS